MTENKKNFLLGLGCEKGGSTWLHDYLATLPDAGMSEPKEFHVFNSRFLPKTNAGSFRVRLNQFLKAIEGRPIQEVIEKGIGEQFIRVMHMYYDLDVYVNHFRKLAAQPHVNMVGEITPLYALLSEENFIEIRDLLAPHFNIKIVYYMRDPVERVHSLVRMKFRDAQKAGKTPNLTPEQMFRKLYAEKAFEEPTRYDETIRKIENVFPKEDIHYGFYETLFDNDEIARLCRFLNVTFRQPDFDKKVNVSVAAGKLEGQAVEEARAYYDGTYKFCADRFGEDQIKKVWANY